MKRFLSLSILLLICALLLTPLAGPTHAGRAAGQGGKKLRKAERPIPDQYIVVLRADVPDAEVDAVARRLTRAHGGGVEQVFTPALKGFLARMSERTAAALSEDPRVEYVEEDGRFSFGATQTSAPNGLDRIDQRDLPLTTTYSYNINATGAGVHAYVIDSGIDTSHVEFGGRAFHNADFSGFGPGDCNGHGTAVASIIGGATTGVAKNVTLHSVRVSGCSGGPSASTLVSAINWVTLNRQSPAVANLSVENGGTSSVDTAVRNSINSGVTYSVIAGNNNTNANNISPARVVEAITVAASDPTNDVRWSGSNFGTVVDLFAPGVSVLVAQPGGQYGFGTGTSFASPFAAGVAAQYLESNPFASAATVQGAIVGNATTNRIFNPGLGTPNRLLYSNFLPNPIDDSRFFVRYHYKDFLNREPDAPDDGGWNFWTNEIEQCNDPNFRGPGESVAVCKARKRVDVSDAFWLATEFLAQQPTLAGLQRGTTAYNAEFVRLCYVVYLRRNPNDPPDNDFTGYNFWLGELNSNNNYKNLVNAFLNSGEYRQRFGPN
jgi:hypothetical protein